MGDAFAAGRQQLRSLFVTDREVAEPSEELFRSAVKASRGLPLAEALLFLIVGFTLDDLGLLRFPGYAIGTLGAVLVLAGGRLLHGRNLARRVATHHPEDVQEALDGARLRNALAAVAAVTVFLVWLVFFTAGVPPWAL